MKKLTIIALTLITLGAAHKSLKKEHRQREAKSCYLLRISKRKMIRE